MILCVSQFNHENAVDVGKTVPGPHFSQPDPVRGKIPCQFKPENDPASLKLRRTGNSWFQEDDSRRKTTSQRSWIPFIQRKYRVMKKYIFLTSVQTEEGPLPEFQDKL
jgi:hypothetical protein